jgi:hypothetical protein
MMLSDAELQELTTLAQAATQHRWQWGHSATSTLEAATAYVADQLAKSEETDIQMVFVGQDDPRVVAITGNGPTSAANARYITALWPGVVLALIHEVQAARRRADGPR